MKPAAKVVLLVVGSYIVTVVAAVIVIVLAIIILLATVAGCDIVTRAILVLWITIAAIFIASVFVVRGLVWKITASTPGRIAMVGVYAAAMLVSYGVFFIGLMVIFNC